MHSDSSFTWPDVSLNVHELQLHRLAYRRLILHMFKRYVEGAIKRKRLNISPEGCLCIVGSVARGEYDVENSDVDLWFIDMSTKERNEILVAISQEFMATDIGLSQNDLVLVRDHIGSAVDANWKKYPILSASDFLTSGHRRSQILFETISVYNDVKHLELQKIALRAAGVTIRGREVRQTPNRLIADIAIYATAVEKRDYSDAVDYGKQLVSRRLGQHFMRLSVIEAVFRKKTIIESSDPARKVIEILRTPTTAKALFWASPEFFYGNMMTKISSNGFKKLKSDITRIVGRFDSEVTSRSDVRTCIGRLAIRATREYSVALNLLHSPPLREVLREIEDFHYPAKSADPNLKQLITTAQRFVSTSTALLDALSLIFQAYDAERLFSRPYVGSGLESALKETLLALNNDIY